MVLPSHCLEEPGQGSRQRVGSAVQRILQGVERFEQCARAGVDGVEQR